MDPRPATDSDKASPVRAAVMPRAMVATSALLVVLAPALVARQAAPTAAWMIAAAVLPLRPRARVAAIVAAYAGAAWCLFSALRVPLGARVVVYALAGAAFLARVWALRTETARRWAAGG